MTGDTNLDRLIASMQAELKPGIFVFATLDTVGAPPGAEAAAIMRFQETEGVTLILPLEDAQESNLRFEYPCRMITLNIHSSLEAVGFLARITTALAAQGLSVNPVSAFFHDHLFVPAEDADRAVRILAELSATG